MEMSAKVSRCAMLFHHRMPLPEKECLICTGIAIKDHVQRRSKENFKTISTVFSLGRLDAFHCAERQTDINPKLMQELNPLYQSK
jgi:hypothetical protein